MSNYRQKEDQQMSAASCKGAKTARSGLKYLWLLAPFLTISFLSLLHFVFPAINAENFSSIYLYTLIGVGFVLFAVSYNEEIRKFLRNLKEVAGVKSGADEANLIAEKMVSQSSPQMGTTKADTFEQTKGTPTPSAADITNQEKAHCYYIFWDWFSAMRELNSPSLILDNIKNSMRQIAWHVRNSGSIIGEHVKGKAENIYKEIKEIDSIAWGANEILRRNIAAKIQGIQEEIRNEIHKNAGSQCQYFPPDDWLDCHNDARLD